jgi:hypothetical protein
VGLTQFLHIALICILKSNSSGRDKNGKCWTAYFLCRNKAIDVSAGLIFPHTPFTQDCNTFARGFPMISIAFSLLEFLQ